MIYETFTNGQCDAIVYTKDPGVAFDEFEIKNFLVANAVQGEEWRESAKRNGPDFLHDRPKSLERACYSRKRAIANFSGSRQLRR